MGVPTGAGQFADEPPADVIEGALRRAVDARKTGDKRELPSILNQLAAGILAYHSIPKREWPSEARDGLFLPILSFVQTRFSSACLLRLLSYNPDAFITPFRFQAYQLFDRALEHDLYKRLKLDPKMQNHEKEEKLKDIVPHVEQALESLVASPLALDGLPAFRTALLKIARSDRGLAAFTCFLPKLELESLLKPACDSMAAYLNAQPATLLVTFAGACQNLEAAIAEAESVHFRYSQRYLAEPLRSVLTKLNTHFAASPVHQAPGLIAQPSDKKYPFYLENKEIDLEIDIENGGPGHAFDVSITVAAITDVAPVRMNISIGDLLSGQTRVRLPVKTIGSATDVALELDMEWRGFDQTRENKRFTLLFLSQRSDINWASLSTEEPYDLEPVTTEAELIGRTDFLNQLVSMVRGTSVGSAIIFGQKRVGKTSLVKTLANRLAKEFPGAYTVVYLETGEYGRPDPVGTIEALGRKLCDELKYADGNLNSVPIPSFDGAFAPLGDFLNQILRVRPDRRLLFILDEFDELPTDLYTHNDVADAFFLSIRSISAKTSVGFVLVGSEKMQAILGLQGHELNKFKTIRVDYFDRQLHWGDFVDLIRRPVHNILEISDGAINALYDYTSGNPYFTKLICKSLFKAMVSRRDGHVTQSEISATVQSELRSVAVNSFLHFWEDGIIEKGEERRRISETRQKTLLCFAECSRRTKLVTLQQMKVAGGGFDLSEEMIEEEVDDFVQRNVFVRDEFIRIKVGFFAEWLRESGPRELLPRLGDRIATLERRREEAAYVSDDEIRAVVDTWKVYKGRRIAIEDVRRWLLQFGANVDQRLMFKLLIKLKFFGEDQIRQRLGTLQQMISRDVAFRYEGKVPRLHDVVISYLDGPGKSGFQYAKLYGEENRIYHENVQEPSRALKSARNDSAVKALVFIDDFLGTGQSATSYFLGIQEELREVAKLRPVPLFLCVIAGFQESAGAVEQELDLHGIRINVRIAEPLADADKAFSAMTGTFVDNDECEKARRLASDRGARLEPKHPLGHGNSQALVVFERSCPNNTLPILWDNSSDWVPLFKRL